VRVEGAPAWFDRLDAAVAGWMARHAITLLRVGLGVVFLWFGLIKFVPGWSPAEGLAAATILKLTGGAVPPAVSLPVLAAWESLIGVGLLTGRFLRLTLLLLFLQMPGTVMPLFLFPAETFTRVPFAPTLEGQYIIKNVVLVAAALAVGATVRGGRLQAEPGRP
jgi:uncharacterized membrane protein YkgB